jgi:hypothetical protein
MQAMLLAAHVPTCTDGHKQVQCAAEHYLAVLGSWPCSSIELVCVGCCYTAVTPLPTAKLTVCGVPASSFGVGGRAAQCTRGVGQACNCLKGGHRVHCLWAVFPLALQPGIRRLAAQPMPTPMLAARSGAMVTDGSPLGLTSIPLKVAET